MAYAIVPKNKKGDYYMLKGQGVKRTTAKKIIDELPVRAEKINHDDKQIHIIKRIAVYGSYVSTDKELLGDLDLAVETANKYTGAIQEKKMKELVNSFSSNKSYLDRLMDAGFYVYRCLIAKNKCLHINPYAVLKASGLEEKSGYTIIYEYKEGKK
jgi:predicted nucleotidyltransferase